MSKSLILLFILIHWLPFSLMPMEGADQSGNTERSNIVIFLADDLGYGDLAIYGNKEIRTPNLDRFAGEGILFTDAYASAPMCSPSRAGLLTGRIPGRTGIYDWIAPDSSFFLTEDEITIATMLKEAGYQTGLFGKWHLWEGGIRVPCMIRWPAVIKDGQVSGEPVSNVDFLPTLAGICGITVPTSRKIDGTDIAPILLGSTFERKIPLTWHFYAPVAGPNSVLRKGDLILTAKWDGGEYTRGRFRRTYVKDIKTAELTDFELYNIKEDDAQENVVNNDHPELLTSLKEELILIHREVREDSPEW